MADTWLRLPSTCASVCSARQVFPFSRRVTKCQHLVVVVVVVLVVVAVVVVNLETLQRYGYSPRPKAATRVFRHNIIRVTWIVR
jgi:hypothetical protein